ncbi:hypothetical protein OE699_02055 [Sedimentimonas flavescens]|uniref:Phage holin n=1 Tax=Sedimentimonas flavescens TaxID=2851012 RepID=A0ABT2ZV47_9RHOB|nr:hypothetical protein [Sedimentimonas flavescens]MCV2877623.1 hypothetical protein [Sedimentimonas flavescens]
MVDGETTIWGDVMKAVAVNTTAIAALWGAAGGLTSALSISEGGRTVDRIGRAIRQVMIGAMAASGGGVALGAAIYHWLGLPAEALTAIGAGSAASYLTGVFGPAMIEVILTRIRRGRLPIGGGFDD